MGDVASSPRTEIMISSDVDGAIIKGDYKLIVGKQNYGFWTSLNYPNETSDGSYAVPVDCGDGCLFNIWQDPSEYEDLASVMPDKVNELRSLWEQKVGDRYYPKSIKKDT